jgi:hypothetical protein
VSENGVGVTRCRPYRKNDNDFVEQKSGDIVRKAVGCHRYRTLMVRFFNEALWFRLDTAAYSRNQ